MYASLHCTIVLPNIPGQPTSKPHARDGAVFWSRSGHVVCPVQAHRTFIWCPVNNHLNGTKRHAKKKNVDTNEGNTNSFHRQCGFLRFFCIFQIHVENTLMFKIRCGLDDSFHGLLTAANCPRLTTHESLTNHSASLAI